MLFSSHVLSEVQKLCSRVAIIKEGRIIQLEAVGALRENGYKKVSLEAKAAVDEALFKMDGLASLAVHDNAASFIFRGNVNQLTKTLAALELVNVTIQEPDLEEIFLHYYQ